MKSIHQLDKGVGQRSGLRAYLFTVAALFLSVSLLGFTGISEAASHHKKHYSWPYDKKPSGYKYKGKHAKNYSWPKHYKGYSWPEQHKKGKSWYKENGAKKHKKHYSWPYDYKPKGYKYKGKHAKGYSWPKHYKGYSWPKQHKKGKSWYKNGQ